MKLKNEEARHVTDLPPQDTALCAMQHIVRQGASPYEQQHIFILEPWGSTSVTTTPKGLSKKLWAISGLFTCNVSQRLGHLPPKFAI